MNRAPWFSTAARRSALETEVRAWLGTPFCLHAQARGGGVDCVHLVHALATATGWPHELRPPAYTAQDTLHSRESKLHAYLDAAEAIELVGDWADVGGRAQIGDLVTFQIGRAAHHLGIVVAARRFVHVMSHHHVAYASLADGTWSGRARRIYRLLDLATPCGELS